jgi:hypothetical protein
MASWPSAREKMLVTMRRESAPSAARIPISLSHVALALLRLVHASERAPGREARLLGAHALCEELVFEELQVRTDLPREIGFGTAGVEERSQPKQETANRSHVS